MFTENKTRPTAADADWSGDGGAVWNGPTGTIHFGEAATSTTQLIGNEAGEGGRGGALWNEGVVKFETLASFSLNAVSVR